MRKFRFVGDPDEYDWDEKPIVGKVYPGTHKGYYIENDFESRPIELWFNDFPEDWEEVTEVETVTKKPLHKDTDLGYFAGLMVANGAMVEDAIYKAKELIKQLDNE